MLVNSKKYDLVGLLLSILGTIGTMVTVVIFHIRFISCCNSVYFPIFSATVFCRLFVFGTAISIR